jgi:hypothetical protein
VSTAQHAVRSTSAVPATVHTRVPASHGPPAGGLIDPYGHSFNHSAPGKLVGSDDNRGTVAAAKVDRARPYSALAERAGKKPEAKGRDADLEFPSLQAQFSRPSSAPQSNPEHLLQTRTPYGLSEVKKKPTMEEIYKSAAKKVPKGSINGSSQLMGDSVGSRPLSGVRRGFPYPTHGPSTQTVVEKALSHGIANKKFGLLDNGGSSLTRPLGTQSRGQRHDYSATPPTRDELHRTAHLAEMFDDDLIDKLDCIIVPRAHRYYLLYLFAAILLNLYAISHLLCAAMSRR